MESEILKFIDLKFKSYLKESNSEQTLSNKDKKLLAEKLLREEFEPSAWIENVLKSAPVAQVNINELMSEHYELMELLSLDIGYRKNLRMALKENFEFLLEHIKAIDMGDIKRWEDYLQFVSVDDVAMFSFFSEEDESRDSLERVVARIDSISDKAKNVCVVSHSAKFSHPDAAYPRIRSVGVPKKDGFTRTGNVNGQPDMHIGAADLQLFKLLELKINNKTLLELFEIGDLSPIANYFCVCATKVDDWRMRFMLLSSNQDARSNRLLKQVYFPVAENYHLLSVLVPTPIVFELKQRVDRINSTSNKAYAGKKSKFLNELHDGFESLPGLTIQRHGGAHPKNISGLNNKHQNIYLLPSMPPSLKPEKVRLPSTHFFSDCVWPNQFKVSFEILHNWLVDSRNNIQVRIRRDELLLDVFNEVVKKIWQIRAVELGWSLRDRFDSLPKPQKIVLDDHWFAERNDDDQYVDLFLKDMARWIVLAYKKVLGNQALPLNDDELRHVYNLIDEQKEALL